MKTLKTLKTFKELIMESADKNEKGDKKEYDAYVKKLMKKYGIDDITDLKGEEKKKFFDELDAGWKGDNEND